MSELASIDESFEAAFSEQEGVPTPEAAEEAVVEEVFVEEPEQATEALDQPEDEEDDLFADIEVDGNDPLEEDTAVDIDSMRFELPGVEEPLTLSELKDGYLRHADYTRKRQADSEYRKQNEKAVRLYDAIQKDPLAAAKQIAEEAGLIQPGSNPTKAVEFSVLNTAEAVEAEIQRRVEEAVTTHPAVVEANTARAREYVSTEFSRIEEAHGVTLGSKSRQRMLQFAADRGISDLELVFNHFMAQKQSRSDQARRVASASPGRPTGRAVDQEVVEEAATIEQAFAMAEAELS